MEGEFWERRGKKEGVRRRGGIVDGGEGVLNGGIGKRGVTDGEMGIRGVTDE